MDPNLLTVAITLGIGVATGVASIGVATITTRQKRLEQSTEQYERALAGRLALLEAERDEARLERDQCRQDIAALRVDMQGQIAQLDLRLRREPWSPPRPP